MHERVKDDELALVDEPRREDDELVDLHAALAQIGEGREEHEEPASAAQAEPARWHPPALSLPKAEGRSSWFAVGGAHDPSSALVRVANDDLQEAALRGDLGLVRRLIHAGASVNAPMRPESDDEFMSLLHVLALKPEMPNGARIMAEVVSRGANLNVRSSLGSTPLGCACLAKHAGAVELLLAARADPAPLDDHGRRACCCAVLCAGTSEELAVECVQLLARANCDLDQGGDLRPIVRATQQLQRGVVRALLEGGAEPEGLHEAVELAPRELIEELVRAEANPFARDRNGKTVMDLALARGDEEITTLLRDFIGDLQRQQHPHLRTLEEQRRQDQEEAERALRSGNASCGQFRLSLQLQEPLEPQQEPDPWQRRLEPLRALCRRCNRSRAFQSLMFACLLLALFLPDLWVLMDVSSNAVLDVLLVAILLAFLAEFAVQAIGLSRAYTCTFFFWMDLVGVVSVPLDHSLVTSLMPQGLDNAVVMRAARMAKLGARAGRFTKLVKLLRFLPGFQEQGSAGTAKVISGKLNMALSTRVSCLIIVMVMLLPLFELLTYPEADFSMRVWADRLREQALEAPELLSEVLGDLELFYLDEGHYPFEASVELADGSSSLVRLSRPVPARERNRVQVRAAEGSTYLSFSFKGPNQVDALCNCLLITTIMVLMVASGLVLMNSVSSIVLVPLEMLLSNVQKIASKIFTSVTSMAKGEKDEDQGDEVHEDQGGFGTETQLLEQVLRKLAVLSEITTKTSPLDAETLGGLGEGDRALLQGYGGTLPEHEHQDMPCPDLRERLAELVEQLLLNAGLGAEDFDSWDLDVRELDEQARLSVCLACLSFHHGAVLGRPAGQQWAQRCTRFLEAASRGYGSPEEVPYHSWAHAVDVTFTLFRALELARAEHYLGPLERFALLVGAVCHDIGHPGLSNPFLVETSHELALRYNDQSPLESMHCARLFELARQPQTAVLSELSRAQHAEARRVCIEAVLHTDYQHHFAMVKELQTLYEVNSELFDTTEEMHRAGCIEFPPREVVDFFRGADVRRHLRVALLHFCDVSNPTKAFRLCEAWAALVVEEFHRQGDRERELGIPVQPLNHRDRANRAHSQLGFIEFFVAPLAFAMVKLVPTLDFCVDTMVDNLEIWFDQWADETEPPPDPDEKAKVRDRTAKLVARWRQ